MIHDMDNDDGHPNANNVVVLLIAMGSAAFVVSIYHLIAILLCNHHITTDQNNQPEQQQQPPRAASAPPAPTSNLNQSSSSLTHMIPTHKYHKKKKKVDHVVSDDDDGTCAVCLGDFEEGEELRTLPECLHSFHVPCIDMWLNSHTSCPICRASATPSPAMLHHGPMPGFGSGDQFNNAHHSIDMTQIALVQNGLVRR